MGWKNLKVWFKIDHIVSVDADGAIRIGSPYIPDLIVVDPDGSVKKRYERSANDTLMGYQAAFDADPEKVRLAIATPDRFEATLPVYTYEGALIVEEECETYGWPNVTHAGHLMFSNTYSRDKTRVIRWARENAESVVVMYQQDLEDLDATRAKIAEKLARAETVLETLREQYPEVGNGSV